MINENILPTPVIDYVDHCIHISRCTRFGDLCDVDKHNILAAMVNDLGFDQSEILLETKFDMINGLKKLFIGEMNAEDFKHELIKGICETYHSRIDDIFEDRINYYKSSSLENYGDDYEDMPDYGEYTNRLINELIFKGVNHADDKKSGECAA